MSMLIDGHTWVKKDDGIYYPDEVYSVESSLWCTTADHNNKTFVFIEYDDHCTVHAMVNGAETGDISGLRTIANELRSAGSNACIITGVGGLEIGGLY